MFRKTVSILFITLFLLTQYGKQLAYLQCKIENISSKSTAPACDCEKKYDKDPGAPDKLPPVKTHVHASTDEYYVIDEKAGHLENIIPAVKTTGHYNASLSTFSGNIFHPPQA